MKFLKKISKIGSFRKKDFQILISFTCLTALLYLMLKNYYSDQIVKTITFLITSLAMLTYIIFLFKMYNVETKNKKKEKKLRREIFRISDRQEIAKIIFLGYLLLLYTTYTLANKFISEHIANLSIKILAVLGVLGYSTWFFVKLYKIYKYKKERYQFEHPTKTELGVQIRPFYVLIVIVTLTIIIIKAFIE